MGDRLFSSPTLPPAGICKWAAISQLRMWPQHNEPKGEKTMRILCATDTWRLRQNQCRAWSGLLSIPAGLHGLLHRTCWARRRLLENFRAWRWSFILEFWIIRSLLVSYIPHWLRYIKEIKYHTGYGDATSNSDIGIANHVDQTARSAWLATSTFNEILRKLQTHYMMCLAFFFVFIQIVFSDVFWW
jgi:hypothetical protein